MRTLAIFVVLATSCLLAGAKPTSGDSPLTKPVWQYYQYKLQFDKSLDSLEAEQEKFRALQETLAVIESHNGRSQSTGYKQAVNHLSDWTHEEFLGKLISQNAAPAAEPIVAGDISWLDLDNFEAPASVDYSADGSRVGPVRDQGACASGWAFATAGLIEGQEARNMTRVVIPLSVQNILDCDQYDRGCSGGDVQWALRAIRDEGGLNTELSYPYEASDAHKCRYNRYDPFIITKYIKRITNLAVGDEQLLQKTVARYGPVAVALDGSLASLKSYKSGVYYDESCRSDTPNHHMLVVGYGTSEDGQDYWKLKNSWSAQWGSSGYLLLARNRNNHCGIASNATIVQISN